MDNRPGYMASLFDVNLRTIGRLVTKLLRFIDAQDISVYKRYADIGGLNPKILLLKSHVRINVDQIDMPDFNFDSLPKAKKYDVIFCFEMIEHLQNPLYFMREVKSLLKLGGVIYLSTPRNPRFLKYDCHFNEMTKDELQKWIFDPLDLQIVKHERFNFVTDCRSLLIGIRPLIRAIYSRDFRPILWGFIYINNFYKIQKRIQ